MSVSFAWMVLNIFNWVLLGYFIAINGVYLVTSIFALRAMLHYTRRLKALDAIQVTAGIEPPITLIAPAYNEEETCVESMRSFLNLSYPDLEVMVVNDGSTDETLARLRAAYQLVPAVRFPTAMIPAQPIRGIYRSVNFPQLWVIDKENGGKADALNVGINCCRTPLFAAMDADTLLERDALPRIIRPFLEDTRTGAVGGIIRIANGCTVENGVVTEIKLPTSWLARFQAIEYMRAFLSGRMGWDAADSTLIISGAFGVFRRQLVVEAGGYRHDTVGEDMELVVRLHRHCRQEKIPLRIGFVPDPVAWTQVPETISGLGRQRDRWQRGLTDSLSRHRSMLFNPRYGKIGMLAFPYFYLLEMFGPVIEFCGYFVFVAYALAQIINPYFALAFIMVAFFLGVSLSLSAVGLGEISFRRYARRRDLMMLFLLAIIENFGYRQLVNFYRIRGMLSALLRHKKWGKQNRTTFDPALVVAPVTVAAVQPEPAIVMEAQPVTLEVVQVVCVVAEPPAAPVVCSADLAQVLITAEEKQALQSLVAADLDRQQARDTVLAEALAADTARHEARAADSERRAILYGELVENEQAQAEALAQEAERVERKQTEVAAPTPADERTAVRSRQHVTQPTTPPVAPPPPAQQVTTLPVEQAALATELNRVRTEREETLAAHVRLAADLDRQRAEHASLTQTLTANNERRALQEQQRREYERRELLREEARANKLAALQAREQDERAAAMAARTNELAALRVRERAEWQATLTAVQQEQAELPAILERLQAEEVELRRRVAMAQPAERAALGVELDRVRTSREETLAGQARLAAELNRQRAEHAALEDSCPEEQELQNQVTLTLQAEQEQLRQDNALQQQLLATQRDELDQAARALTEQHLEQDALTAKMLRLREECATLQTERETAALAPPLVTAAPVETGARETRYYFNLDGRQYGPATLTELGDLAQICQVSPHDWVWLDTQQEWAQLQDYSPTAALCTAAQPGSSEPVAAVV